MFPPLERLLQPSELMRLAMPIWAGRIAPVFDVAQHLVVVEVKGDREVARQEWSLREAGLADRTANLVDGGIDILICGAISRPLDRMLVEAGIQVVAHTCGRAEEVLQAFLTGQFSERSFLMPGCRRRGGARRRRRRRPPRSTMLSEGSLP